MYSIKVSSYPNREIRAVLTKVREAATASGGVRVGDTEEMSIPDRAPTLDISAKLETSDGPVARRATRFGLAAKRTLLRIGGAITEYDPCPGHGIFITGTLPGSTPAALAAMAEYSSWIVHRVKAWIAKRLPGKLDFYVWELQRRGALHLHYFVHCPDPEIRAGIIAGWKDEWVRLLLRVGHESGCNMFQRGFGDRRIHAFSVVQAYAQEVTKSVAAYLAKYCSKNAGKPNSNSVKYCPTRWWGCSRPLLHLMQSYSTSTEVLYSGVNHAHTALERLRDSMEVLSDKCYTYNHKVGVGATFVQYYSGELWKMARQLVKKLVPHKLNTPDFASTFQYQYQALLTELANRMVLKSTLFTSSIRQKMEEYSKSFRSCGLLGSQASSFQLRSARILLNRMSCLCTSMKMSRYLTSEELELHLAQLRFIWRIQGSNADCGVMSEERCELLLQIYKEELARAYRSTTEVEKPGPPPEEKRGLELVSPPPTQLVLIELNG